MRIQMQTPISQLVDGGHYWAKLQECDWGVWQFRGGHLCDNHGAVHLLERFDQIGTRVYTPEEVDAQDQELARMRGWMSAISVETAYAADTLEEATDAMATVTQMADMALEGADVPATGQLAVSERPAVLRALAERKRQQTVEGWTPEHDDQYTNGQLALAACAYIEGNPVWWPVDFDPAMLKLSTRERDLEKGIALAVAELERIDRAADGAAGGDA